MHRRRLNASRNMGVLATVFALALKVAGTFFRASSTCKGRGPSASAQAQSCRCLPCSPPPRVGRRDVVMDLRIAGGAREFIQVANLVTSEFLCEFSAPGDQLRRAPASHAWQWSLDITPLMFSFCSFRAVN